MYVYVYVCIYTHISTYTYRYIDFIIYIHIEYIYVIFICIFMYIHIFKWYPSKEQHTFTRQSNWKEKKVFLKSFTFVVPGEDYVQFKLIKYT